MYMVNYDLPLKCRIHFDNQNEIAKKIGITPSHLSRIINGKIATRKMVAYCIVKLYDPEGEILDYFVRVK